MTVRATITGYSLLALKVVVLRWYFCYCQVGVLSEGNFQSVLLVLPDGVEMQVYNDTQHAVDGVLADEVVVGLISGLPPNEDGLLNVVPSTLVSPRASLFRQTACDEESSDKDHKELQEVCQRPNPFSTSSSPALLTEQRVQPSLRM